MSPSRREFLALPTLTFAFRDDTIANLLRVDFANADPDDDAFWRGVRAQFDVDPGLTSFNHAGLSPSPRSVREALTREVERANAGPSRVVWRQQEKELEPIRARLARLVGCSSEELALTPNATYGLHTAILGIPLERGDAILTTSHDYSRAFNAMRQRERRDGTVTIEVPLTSPPADPEAIASDVISRITSRTRLIVLSQMTFTTGQILPIRRIADVAEREGIPLLVDAAHGIGLLADSWDELRGSFYTACLHKWMMGPVGTGVFAVRSAWIDRCWALHPGEEALDRRITKFEQWGTHPVAPFLALREALDFHEHLGLERKAARLEVLRRRLVEPLLDLPGVTFHGSLDTERSRAILAVSFAKVEPGALANWLWKEHGIHVTTVERAGLRAVRLSPHVFTTFAEVDRLAGLLAGVALSGI